MQRAIGRLRAGGGVDADALLWRAAVIANSGTVSGTTLTAVSNFVKAAKVGNYWTKLNRVNLLCGDQLAACLVPLKVGGGSALDTNTNYVSGDYTEATGLTGNGTKYLRTGLIPSTSLTLNDTHLALYNRGSTAATQLPIGCRTSNTASLNVYAPATDGLAYSQQHNTVTVPGGSITVALAAPYGFVVGTRTASNLNTLYRNGSSIASSALADTTPTLPNIEIYVGAENSSGSPGGITTLTFAGYSIGSGLSAANMTAYNTDIQAFQTALGRAV